MSGTELALAVATEMSPCLCAYRNRKFGVRLGLPGLVLTLMLWMPCLAIASDDPPGWTRGRLTLRIAPEFSSGDYGDDSDTDVWYVPLSVRYQFTEFPLTSYQYDRLTLGVTIPYIRVNGPGGVVGGTGGPIDIHGQERSPAVLGDSTTASDEAGLGDILLKLFYHLLPAPSSKLPWLTVSGKIKIPSASESKGLGTGEADYTLFSELYQPLGAWGIFAGGGYRFMGDPEDFDLNDRWLASAGFDVQLASAVSAGLSYDYRESTTSSSAAAHELSPWLSFGVFGAFRIEPYGLIGLSSGSPDYGLGVRLSWSGRTGTRSVSADRRKLPSRTDQES